MFLAGVPVHKETDDLCSKAVCPVAVGKTVIKTVTFMPGITPRGRYRIQLTGLLPDGLPVREQHLQRFGEQPGLGGKVPAAAVNGGPQRRAVGGGHVELAPEELGRGSRW